MKQIIVLEQSKEATLVGLHLSKNQSLNIIKKKEMEELFSLLEFLNDVDLIICDSHFENEILAKHNNFKIFKVGVKSELEENIKKITQIIGEEINPSENSKGELEQYKSISIDYFSSIQSLSVNSDLFIKIKKGNSEQFVKRLNANEIFTSSEIEKYTQLGLSEFYVPRNNYEMVVNSIINILTDELSNGSNSFESQKNIEHSTYHISIERMRTIGLDQFTIQLVNETVSSITKSLNEKSALGKFLKFLTDNKSSYAYASSYLTCLTMTSLLKVLKREIEVTEEEITLACFFHNMSLEDETSLKIFSTEQLDSSNFSKEKKNEIKLHALTASSIVSDYEKMTPLILTLIKEHHGSLTGVDFPATPNVKLHPMSRCFMVCEFFADQVAKHGPNIKKSDVEQIVTNLKKKFNTELFSDFTKALEKMIAS